MVRGAHPEGIEAAIDWNGARRVLDPAPDRGLSSSVRVGLGRMGPASEPILVALGDQPLVSVHAIRTLLDAAQAQGPADRGPGLRRRAGAQPRPGPERRVRLIAAVSGDRGLGPIIDAHPELVRCRWRGPTPTWTRGPILSAPSWPTWAASVSDNAAGRAVPRGRRRRGLLRDGHARSAPTRRGR